MNDKLIQKIYREMIPIRHELHQHPELSQNEVNTSKKISQLLRKWNIEQVPSCQYGTIGLIKGAKDGKTIAIRADIDALPIAEKTTLSYASTNGAMHACGHDIHTATLLGTAKYFKTMEDELTGNVKCLFQPNEECSGGAKPMIEAGALKEPKVDYVIGLHTDPNYEVGHLAFKEGFLNAAVNNFKIILKSSGGHGGHPHLTKDPIVCAGQIIIALQTLVSRRTSPFDPAVISIGSIHGGSACNIIPSEVTMEGTIRSSNEMTRNMLIREFKKLVQSIADGMNIQADIHIEWSYISLNNDIEITKLAKNFTEEALGSKYIHELPHGSMGGDDFSYFSENIPGTFYNLGVSKNPTTASPLHSDTFIAEDEAIYYGIKSQVAIVLGLLNH